MHEQPNTANNKFLVVDDDAVFRSRIAKSLRARAFEVFEASSTPGALICAEREHPNFILTDLRMPGESGLDLVRAMKNFSFETKVVVFTGYGSIATALEAVRAGATNYLTKPADLDEILLAFGSNAESPDHQVVPKTPSLAQVEWEHIQRVLSDCQGNITQAAKRLGLHRRSLQRKLEKNP